MPSKRTRRWIGAGIAALLVVGGGLVVGELVARHRLDERADSLSGALPGVSVRPAGGLALVELATGSVPVRVTATDTALNALAHCRTDQEVTVRAVSGGMLLGTERTLRGTQVPVQVLLVPRHDESGWNLAADSVSVAGVSLPAGRALGLLSGRNGSETKLAQKLLDGIPLSPPDMVVQDVAFSDGSVDLTANIAVARDGGDKAGAGLTTLRDCLTAPEPGDQKG